MADPEPRYRRILVKLSGEALMGSQSFGIEPAVVRAIAAELAAVVELGVQVAVVVGGGNIIRGVSAHEQGIDRVTGDSMGMLATVINALALSSALEQLDVPTRVQTAIEMHQVAEPFIRRRAIRHLEKQRVVVFAAGTGSPFFTTDSAAALRANEIQAEVLMKATKVDGVYTADPVTHSDARLMPRLDYQEVLSRGLRVMDAAAISLCMESQIPIQIFNIHKPGILKAVVLGGDMGSLIGPGEGA
ncbi:MAG TPA: UMP kinase [Candidatus Sulfomarinibacteraceae bacterium]|nr:UMP kinase [Candidatus Sulfomarinibacteraceae bacterium]